MNNINVNRSKIESKVADDFWNKLERADKNDIEEIPNKCTVLPYDIYKFKSSTDNKLYLDIFKRLIVFMKNNYNMKVNLSKYDLFHGHLCIDKNSLDGVKLLDGVNLLILFHIREYPKNFPIPLGYCQKESNIMMDKTFEHRNIKYSFIDSSFVVLYPIKKDITNTIRESTLGKPIADIYLLDGKNVYVSLR